jgi:pimeloyl-ACP methyl ester carboxylesterase
MTIQEFSVTIDGRRLCSFLAGEGGPAVVLDAGLGDTASTWSKVQPEVARFTRVFSYDRAGLGRSDTAPGPRTCREIVGDLKSILSAAGLAPPYILVAHSWSGINARWYASEYPDELAGLVLVDAVHEDKYEHFARVMSADRAARMWSNLQDPQTNDERIDRLTSLEQVRRARPIFEFPVSIVTRNISVHPTTGLADELDEIETRLQGGFLKMSARSKQYVAKTDDHFIQQSEPELVIEAIREIAGNWKAG